MDRIYRELNVNHTTAPKVHLDAFILKISVYKNDVGVTENTPDVIEKMTGNADRVSEKVSDVIENDEKFTENRSDVIEKQIMS